MYKQIKLPMKRESEDQHFSKPIIVRFMEIDQLGHRKVYFLPSLLTTLTPQQPSLACTFFLLFRTEKTLCFMVWKKIRAGLYWAAWAPDIHWAWRLVVCSFLGSSPACSSAKRTWMLKKLIVLLRYIYNMSNLLTTWRVEECAYDMLHLPWNSATIVLEVGIVCPILKKTALSLSRSEQIN